MQYFLPNPTSEDTSIVSDLSKPLLLFVGTHDYRGNVPPRMLHSHANMTEMVFFADGGGTCTVDGKTYETQTGDLMIYNADVLHLDDCGYLLICGAANISLPELPPNHLIPAGASPLFHLGDKADTFRNILLSMIDVAASNTPNAAETCQYLFLAYLNQVLSLLKENQTLEENPQVSKESIKNRGKDIQTYVDQHISERLTLTEIAEHFDLSPFYVSRVFKLATGHNLNSYQTQRRIGRAQTLLLTTKMSMSEIAETIGYASQGYFSKQFQEIIGISPMQYRKQFGGRRIGQEKER